MMSSDLSFLLTMIKEAGQLARNYFVKDQLDVQNKSSKDLVSEADLNVEKFICESIKSKFPEDGLFGEEYGKVEGNHREWIIDPIDGTGSFCRKQPYFSVSIALFENGKAKCGAVYAPILGELFYAERGEGAFCNGNKICVSKSASLEESVLATGFACIRSNLSPNNMPFLNALLPKLQDMRRYGSAAIDLCYVACGRLDGFWELYLKPYDYAAGQIILEEAGGVVTDFEDSQENCETEILASNKFIHNQIVEIFKEVKGNL